MQNDPGDPPDLDFNEQNSLPCSLTCFSVCPPSTVSYQGGANDEPPSLVVMCGYWLNEMGWRGGGTLMAETEAGKMTLTLVSPAKHVMAVDPSKVPRRVFFIDIHSDRIR